MAETADPREAPTYSITEAARYLGMSRHTLRSWVIGRLHTPPLIQIADYHGKMLSFFDLAEAHVLCSTRQFYGVQISKPALAYIQAHWPSRHPLLSMKLHTDGKSIFIKTIEETISASAKGQTSFRPIVDAYLERIEFGSDGEPIRLFPFRIGTKQQQAKRIVIDPLVSSGQPVVAGSGVPVLILCARHSGGETIKDLAADYGLEPGEVEEAIQFCEAA
jgi:uncharacterized protein (DUF433 family)